MLYGKYRFICQYDSEAVLPCYKGSTFRGVFGRALKQVVCALKQQECPRCLLRERCVYVDIFETPFPPVNSRNHSGMIRPHPFVIEPPETLETHFSPGSKFEFNLLLFGKTNDYLPYFIYAFDRISHIGLGRKINSKRGTFQLKSVTLDEKIIYSDTDKQLKMPSELTVLQVPDVEYSGGISRIKLTLKTPLRLKFENRFKADLPFHVLVRGMLRRVSSIMEFHGDGEPTLDYRGLVKRAEAVNTVEDNLEWFDWRRYSFRQDKAMLMGGLTGTVVYEGDIGEFMPLVRFCEAVHVGKQTTFGLGKINVEIIS